MKIAYEKLTTVLEYPEIGFLSLVIEEPRFYYEILEEFRNYLEGTDTGIVISENDKPWSSPQRATMVMDYLSLNLSSKTVITKVIRELQSTAEDETFYMETHILLAQLEELIYRYSQQKDYELGFEKLNMSSLLKSIGIYIEDDSETLEERLLAYMDLMMEVEGKELFIFVNLRSFVPADRLESMIETALQREHRMLLVDGAEYPRLAQEKRLIIDQDLCEI